MVNKLFLIAKGKQKQSLLLNGWIAKEIKRKKNLGQAKMQKTLGQ